MLQSFGAVVDELCSFSGAQCSAKNTLLRKDFRWTHWHKIYFFFNKLYLKAFSIQYEHSLRWLCQNCIYTQKNMKLINPILDTKCCQVSGSCFYERNSNVLNAAHSPTLQSTFHMLECSLTSTYEQYIFFATTIATETARVSYFFHW